MESRNSVLAPASGGLGENAVFGDGVGLSTRIELALGLVVDQLDAALDFAEAPSLDDAEVVSALIAVEGLQRKITALQLVLAAEAEDRTRGRAPGSALALKYGCRNTVELLQRTALVSGREARQRVRLGQLVVNQNGYSSGTIPARYPFLGDALAQGHIGVEAVLSITNMLGKVHVHDGNQGQIEVAERELVNAASFSESDTVSMPPMHADQTRVQCDAWQQFLEADGVLPSEEAAFLKRGFRFGRRRDGLVPVSGALVPETAALLGRLFDSVNSPRTDANPEGSPSDEAQLVDSRMPDQKRHDALAVLLETAARHSDTPLLGGAPVTVLIQVSEDDLAAAPAVSESQGRAWLQDHSGESVPISMAAVRHAACSGATQRVTQDRTGRIVGIGSPDRLFNARQRRAITLRDGGCVIPGCTTPASWCEVHHVIEHARGGPTHTDNGVLLCWYHHRYIDTNGWHVRMNNGVPETRAPGWIDPGRPWRPHRPPASIHWPRQLASAA